MSIQCYVMCLYIYCLDSKCARSVVFLCAFLVFLLYLYLYQKITFCELYLYFDMITSISIFQSNKSYNSFILSLSCIVDLESQLENDIEESTQNADENKLNT